MSRVRCVKVADRVMVMRGTKEMEMKEADNTIDTEKITYKKAIGTIGKILREVSEDICDNYCKYRDTADEECLCDVIRNGGSCPLDRLQ